MRTWHLQSAIMWIATSYVAAALFLGCTLRRDEPHGLAVWMHLLFVAFVAVISGSLLGEWAGISQLFGRWWFWIGNQGWEYLELGRLWQYLLAIGLLVWFRFALGVARPSKVENRRSAADRMDVFVAACPSRVLPAGATSLVRKPITRWSTPGASGSSICGSRASSSSSQRR
jgi:nitric oxide reductase large subunit